MSLQLDSSPKKIILFLVSKYSHVGTHFKALYNSFFFNVILFSLNLLFNILLLLTKMQGNKNLKMRYFDSMVTSAFKIVFKLHLIWKYKTFSINDLPMGSQFLKYSYDFWLSQHVIRKWQKQVINLIVSSKTLNDQ